MNGGNGGTAVKRTESDEQRAYRLWLEHVLKCTDCKRVSRAQEGCEDGQELWGAYRLARIGRTL